jgi:hypothetical protein
MPYRNALLGSIVDDALAAPGTKDELTALIRAKVAAGVLRHDECRGGSSCRTEAREDCHACARAIGVDEVEMRPKFGDRELMRLHARCFAVWHQQTQHRAG